MYPHPEKLNSKGFTPPLKTRFKELIFEYKLTAYMKNVLKKMFLTKGNLSSRAGFTLIEALVSLVILTIALGPALILSSNISSTASVIQNNLIAANLAQEGVEVIRALRDASWYNGLSFDTGLADGIYRTDWNSNILITLGSNPPLKVSDGLYNYSSGTETMFKRTITITKINSEELRVVSDVTWTERGNRTRDVKVESHLFDWK